MPFEVSTIESPVAGFQTVLAGRFRDAALADVFIVTTDEQGRRTGRLHEQSAGGRFDATPRREVEFDASAIVVDTGRLGDRDAIVWIGAEAVIHYDPYEDTVRRLVRGSSIYAVPKKRDLPKVDFFRDINGDRLDDLVIPTFNGYRVHVQRADGSFAPAVEMTAPPVMDTSFDNHPWYQPQPMFRADMTGNGLRDVVFWIDGHFRIYALNDDGTFASEPLERASAIQFEFAGIDNVSARLRDEDQSDLQVKALYQLRDLTGDGLAELVTLTIDSQGVFRKETTYHIHRGVRDEDGVPAFRTSAMSVIASRGIQFETAETDVNADGQVDLAISSVRIGIGKIIGALLTGSVDFDLDFYPMKDGAYEDAPAVSRNVTATFDLSSGDFFYPFVMITDITGDDIAELLVQDGMDTIRIFAGTGDESLFARSSIDVKLELPNDADLVELVDLNGDGRKDVVMRIEKKNEPGRVSLLVTKPDFTP